MSRTDARPSVPRRGRLLLDLLLAAAGVALVLWGIIAMADPSISCRGVTMGPGDVCHKSSFTATNTSTTQTYEQRRRAVAQSRPVVIGLGVVAAGYGGAMAAARVRRARRD
ncbi:hypothetical protein [Acidipropionibacterium timonense]|uniref:hypothetical protein n=1 Tax=Acidipropionibacterium timonense TaxID=2161818 RepID=UPI0010303897